MKNALEHGASTLDDLARTIDEKDPAELVEDVKRIARDNPTSFLIGCAALGFTAARIFKSTASPASGSHMIEQPSGRIDQQIAESRSPSGAEDRTAFAFSDPLSSVTSVKPDDVGSSL